MSDDFKKQIKEKIIKLKTKEQKQQFLNCIDKKSNKLTDKYTFEILNRCLDKYIQDINFNEEINKLLSKKKIRHINFPSDISENIVKFAIYKKYSIMPSWDTKKGDLVIDNNELFKQIEVKGFISIGPSSFGPLENWDWIYFVDGIDIRNKKFKVYEIQLSNTSEVWKNIIISGNDFIIDNSPLPNNLDKLKNIQLKDLCKQRGLKQSGNKEELIKKLNNPEEKDFKFKEPKTYEEICKKNSRGELRSSFYKTFKPQLGKHCKLIFDGHISELNNVN